MKLVYGLLAGGMAVAVSGKAASKGRDRADELYDHMDGLLDKNEGQDLEKMTEEEKKQQLELIYHKIDTDSDGQLTEKELNNWMMKTSKKYMMEDVANQYPAHDRNEDGKVTWDEYYESVFKYIQDSDIDEINTLSKDEMIARDKRRFTNADNDGDETLDQAEFAAFLHPEDHPHMKDIVVQETLEDLDKNGDGKIDIDEYIKDMYHPENDSDGEDTPDWLDIEKDHFRTIRDKDGDGFLNLDEVRDWLMPNEYDHIEAEATHLVTECDKNDDQKLSLDEVLQHYDIFMTSQATNFGEALNYHDEL